MLQDLDKTTIVYNKLCWINPSLLNGSTGIVLRIEGDKWIIQLSSSKSVSTILCHFLGYRNSLLQTLFRHGFYRIIKVEVAVS